MSATAQTLKTPRQQNLPLPPIKLVSVKSTRGLSPASLRPGDWVAVQWPNRNGWVIYTSTRPESVAFVVQNSAKLGRVELETRDGGRETFTYAQLANAEYLGQGRRRWWWKRLPELLRKYVSQFSCPQG